MKFGIFIPYTNNYASNNWNGTRHRFQLWIGILWRKLKKRVKKTEENSSYVYNPTEIEENSMKKTSFLQVFFMRLRFKYQWRKWRKLKKTSCYITLWKLKKTSSQMKKTPIGIFPVGYIPMISLYSLIYSTCYRPPISLDFMYLLILPTFITAFSLPKEMNFETPAIFNLIETIANKN